SPAPSCAAARAYERPVCARERQMTLFVYVTAVTGFPPMQHRRELRPGGHPSLGKIRYRGVLTVRWDSCPHKRWNGPSPSLPNEVNRPVDAAAINWRALAG